LGKAGLRKVSQGVCKSPLQVAELAKFFAVFGSGYPGMDVALISMCMGGLMNRVKTLPIMFAALLLFTFVIFGIVRAQGEVQPSDPAAFYKAKCVACHGPKAEKRFDAALTDEQYIDAILKGKKPEKPPNMPAYGEKGVTAEQAKALLDYMKQLRTAQ
jgi:mono/diheme cytochrome c family protein